jgi:SAM-dependent methyltransferase
MKLQKAAETLGKDHYRLLYQNELELEAEWLARGAGEKVNSIAQLLQRNEIEPKSILELGCGTGAVIKECQRRNLSEKYLAVDYAPEAIEYLRKHAEGIEAIQGDITDPDFHISDAVDLFVLSHVLEHLENPAAFLGAIKTSLRFRYAVIEVPLENLLASRIKSIVQDRTVNKAGHIQFFTSSTFERLLSSNGFKVIDRRTYVPILDVETIRFVSDKDGLSKLRYGQKLFTGHYLPSLMEPLWKKLYYAHHAVLCKVDY